MPAATPLRARNPAAVRHPLRLARCNPTPRRLGATAVRFPLRFARCNPTPRRLGAARVWTIVRVEIIAVQPDLTGHKLEPVRSFRVHECCGTRVRCSKTAIIAMFCKKALCRESKEESPERPQSGFHISAPAYSPRCHNEKAVHIKRNVHPTRRFFSYSRLRSPSPVGIAYKKRTSPK